MFGALFVQDRATVDLGGDLEADPSWEIGFDRAGHNIDGWSLGSHDQVNAGGPCHLRQSLHGGLNLFAGDQHQVCHFVDDDDDVWERREIERLLLHNRLAGLRIKAGLHGPSEFLALVGGIFHPLVVSVDISDAEFRHV